jgi:tetratricopeptide (TPR) repeat protein
MLVDTDGILGMHNLNVTGEEEKAIHSFQLWAKSYPRDFHPLANVSIPYSIIGQYEKAEEATRKALRLRPDAVGLYENQEFTSLSTDSRRPRMLPNRRSNGSSTMRIYI